MQDIANEMIAYLDYINVDEFSLRAREDGGFELSASFGYASRYGYHKPEVVLFQDIQSRLKNPRSRVSSLREKFEKFKNDTIRYAGFTIDYASKKYHMTDKKASLANFNEFLKDYYEDDATSVGTSQGSSVDDLTNTMGRIDLSGAGAPSAEQERQDAMKHPFIEEKLADFSDIFGNKREQPDGKFKGEEFLQATGLKEHGVYGEKHHSAKLKSAEATAIRVAYWSKAKTQIELAEQYHMKTAGINHVLTRYSWKHLPQVEGEPDEVFNAPNHHERVIRKLAQQYGVEPIRNKIGRLRLPDELIKRLKAEKQAQPKVEKTTTAKKSKKTKESKE